MSAPHRRRAGLARSFMLATALGGAAIAAGAQAQTQTRVGVPGKGEGSASATFQYIAIEERDVGFGIEEFGRIDLRSLYLDLDYGLTDRVALTLWAPFKSNRYRGDMPHDPRLLLDPRGERFLDDGEWHSSWADWGVGLRWLWRETPVVVTPFVSFHYPSRDYPLFTETQAGTGQWRLDLGVNAADRFGPPHWNLYWQAGFAYSVMEKTRPRDAPDRRVNRSIVHLSLGKLLTPATSVNLTFTRRDTYNALNFPDEFNFPLEDDLFYWHDQLLPWEYTTAAIGIGHRIGERYHVHFSYGRTIELRFGHKYDPAVTIGITRSF